MPSFNFKDFNFKDLGKMLKNLSKNDILRLVCAVLAAIFAVISLVNLIDCFGGKIIPVVAIVHNLICTAAYGIIAYCLAVKRHDSLLAFGVCGIALIKLIGVLDSIFGISEFFYRMQIDTSNMDMPMASSRMDIRGMLFGFFNFICEAADIISIFALAYVALVLLTDFMPKKCKDIAEKYWYAVPALFAIKFVLGLIIDILGFLIVFIFNFEVLGYLIGENIYSAIYTVFFIVLFTFITNRNISEILSLAKKTGGNSTSQAIPCGGDGYISLITHTLLLIFTFGIWQLVWVYKTTKYLNNDKSLPARDPVTKLLLYMFIPMYAVYWNYQTARRAVNLLPSSSGKEGTITLITISSLINPLLGAIITQDVINNGTYSVTERPVEPANQTEFYDIMTHAILLVVTFGIWQFVWIYRTSVRLKRANMSGVAEPGTAVVLSIFIPLYSVFWAYKASRQINKIAVQSGKNGIDTCIATLLAMLAPIVSFILIQDAMNNL